MIIVYSELKKLLPDLSVSGQKLADVFSLIGHFCSGYQKTNSDEIYNLEIRAANRPDCLGYMGIARDLSAYFNIPLTPPKITPLITQTDNKKIMSIRVSSPSYVKSLFASLITNLQISSSPIWLSELLTNHEINPVNNLVDITNYIMLLYGLPSHAFDAKKVDYSLDWTHSNPGDNITTFDGTLLDLPGNTLVIKSKNKVVSLSTIGGQKTGITTDSTDTILEMAIYEPTKVHQDAQALNIQTEAKSRLEKLLSPEEMKTAFFHLQSLVCQHCRGQVVNQDFNFNNYISTTKKIFFDPNSPSKYAGTEITASTALQILNRLGCQINQDQSITTPTWRTDLNLPEDLIEEVIRIYGYNHIPTNQPIDSKSLPNITPISLSLSTSLTNLLVSMGYDEIRSWPLIQEKHILSSENKNSILKTENNINNEYPYLRKSIISSLIKQADIYSRYCLPNPKFFEIGKIFQKTNSNYQENLAVGIFCQSEEELSTSINTIIKTLNLDIPSQSYTKYTDYNGYYAQIILDGLTKFLPFNQNISSTQAIELTSQITSLDATITFQEKQDEANLISFYTKKINQDIFWSIFIKDYYFDSKTKKHNYTFTANYYNCTSQLAKSIHLKAFGLI